MTGKILGKITFAEFGTIRDYPFLIGLQLGFDMADGTSIMDGGKYTVNISPECRWESETERDKAMTRTLEFTNKILKDAKVSRVSELVGKPVEIELDRNWFKDFRILTEVL